jgi:hypothetical protein
MSKVSSRFDHNLDNAMSDTPTVDQILVKLTTTQLRQLIDLFGRPKPGTKATKSDILTHIKELNLPLDVHMLIKYFGIGEKKSRSKKNDDNSETNPVFVKVKDHE